MTFRLRLTVMASLAVAATVVGASFAVYYTDRHELIKGVDADLRSTLALRPLNEVIGGGPGVKIALGGRVFPSAISGGYVRTISPKAFRIVLPRLSAAVRAQLVPRKVGASPPTAPPQFRTVSIDGVPTRKLTLLLPTEEVTVTRSLLDVSRNLSHLAWLLVFISLGGVGAAAILGAFVSRRAVAPLRRLTETTERILATGDLGARTGVRGRDEISRLSARLDELLASLDASLRTQRQLVADASHELRTPIATLRANYELLAEPGALDEHERKELLLDVRTELEDMTVLVAELTELARGEEANVPPEAFRLDEVVRGVVERAARRAPQVSFRTVLQPTVVTGVPERVERAVANLLDNAGKWTPPGECVDVRVEDGLVEVRDRGPGIADEDAPFVFDRFYRSIRARGMPGAGLGLAIVKQIADAHGGSVSVDHGSDGGAILRLQL